MESFGAFALRTSLAGLCGLLIGIDRELKSKPLGARAYILVSFGSGALMVVTINFSFGTGVAQTGLSVDPTRWIQGIVGGIGFLGAGAIITTRDDGQLRGAGSGAAIWGAGATGIACGLGYYAEAIFVAVVIFAVLNIYDWLERRTNVTAGSGNDPAAGYKSRARR